MSNFGALTDHFGFADANLVLISSSKTPPAKTRKEASDEAGDFAAITHSGGAGTFDAECVYSLVSGTLDLADLVLGEIEEGKATGSIVVATDAGAFPTITVTGKLGTEKMCAPDGKKASYTIPAQIIKGCKLAQAVGFTVSKGNLTSCTVTLECDIVEQEDGAGEPAAHGVGGGVMTVQAEFVRASADAPAWTPSLGFAESQALGVDEPQADYHTASGALAKALERADAGGA
jgi:hypothetical protein